MNLLLHTSGTSLRACRWESLGGSVDPVIMVGGNEFEWAFTSHYDLALDGAGKVIGFSIALEKKGSRIKAASFVKETHGVESAKTALWMLNSDHVTDFDEIQGFCEVYECKQTGDYAFVIWSLNLWKDYELSSSIQLAEIASPCNGSPPRWLSLRLR